MHILQFLHQTYYVSSINGTGVPTYASFLNITPGQGLYRFPVNSRGWGLTVTRFKVASPYGKQQLGNILSNYRSILLFDFSALPAVSTQIKPHDGIKV